MNKFDPRKVKDLLEKSKVISKGFQNRMKEMGFALMTSSDHRHKFYSKETRLEIKGGYFLIKIGMSKKNNRNRWLEYFGRGVPTSLLWVDTIEIFEENPKCLREILYNILLSSKEKKMTRVMSKSIKEKKEIVSFFKNTRVGLFNDDMCLGFIDNRLNSYYFSTISLMWESPGAIITSRKCPDSYYEKEKKIIEKRILSERKKNDT